MKNTQWRNGDGYYNPTAGRALLNVARDIDQSGSDWLIVYIASPYSGDTEHNVEQARKYCHFAISRRAIPLAPHLHYPQFLDDNHEGAREIGIRCALALLDKCDELWVFGEHITDGMAREIEKAEACRMPIRYWKSRRREITQCTS